MTARRTHSDNNTATNGATVASYNSIRRRSTAHITCIVHMSIRFYVSVSGRENTSTLWRILFNFDVLELVWVHHLLGDAQFEIFISTSISNTHDGSQSFIFLLYVMCKRQQIATLTSINRFIAIGRRWSRWLMHPIQSTWMDWASHCSQETQALFEIPNSRARERVLIQCVCLQTETLGIGQEFEFDWATGEFHFITVFIPSLSIEFLVTTICQTCNSFIFVAIWLGIWISNNHFIKQTFFHYFVLKSSEWKGKNLVPKSSHEKQEEFPTPIQSTE